MLSNESIMICIYVPIELKKRLTINKKYKLLTSYIWNECQYCIIDDQDCSRWYSIEYFKSISEYRNEKIENLI